MSMQLEAASKDELRKNSLSTISLICAIGSWSLLPVYIFSAQFAENPRHYFEIFGLGLIFSIILTIAWFIQRTGRRAVASWLIVISTGVATVAVNFILASLGEILTVIALLVLLNIAWQSMTMYQARIASVIIVILAPINYLADKLLPQDTRLIAPLMVQQSFVALGGIVILIVSINLLQYISFRSLRHQIIAAFLIVAYILLGIEIIPQLSHIVQDHQFQQQENAIKATSTSVEYVDEKLTSIAKNLEIYTQLPGIHNITNSQANLSIATEILRSIQRNNTYIQAFGVVSTDGTVLLDSKKSFRAGRSEKNTSWFQKTLITRKTFISDVTYDDEVIRPVFFVSAPILNNTKDIIGILRVEYDVAFLTDTLSNYINESFSNNFSGMIIDANGIILAHTKRADLQFKTATLLDPNQLKSLQDVGLLPQGSPQDSYSGMVNIDKLILQNNLKPASYTKPVFSNDARNNVIAAQSLKIKNNWQVIVYTPESDSIGAVFTDGFQNIAIVLIMFFVIIFAANIIARIITTPVITLTNSAMDISHGNFLVNMHTDRKDEIGTLGNVLANMTSQLGELIKDTENKITQRTTEMSEANRKITEKNKQLIAINQLGQSITGLPNMDRLLPLVAEKISVAFNFYHVGIFLMDPSGEFAILTASNSAGGRKMIEKGLKIRPGQVGVVGYSINTGQARIAVDVGEDATFFNNPDLPNTRSEMSLPILISGKVAGVLDLQSDMPAAFSKDDIETFTLLAEELSMGIQNARLFEETQQALTEAQTLYQKAVKTSWREIISQETAIFHYANGAVEQIQPKQQHSERTVLPIALSLPIIIRGQELGRLEIHTEKQVAFTEQELRVYKSIIDRIAFTLENARLFRDAQKLATKERIIGEISSKLGTSNKLDNILETAVKELGQVIPDTEVIIQLTGSPSQNNG